MIKKLINTSFVIVIVPTMLFCILYAFMYYTVETKSVDYSQDVLGKWDAIQYYAAEEKVVCGDQHPVSVIFTENNITFIGNDIPQIETTYQWSGGSNIKIEYQGEELLINISFDNNNLKLKIGALDYTFLFERSEDN